MITAIVVNRNGERWLDRCLASLGRPPAEDLEVILVDNASDDGSLELVARDFGHVRVLRMGHNAGFAVANNLAAACARGDELLLLNNDAWLENGALDRMRRTLRRRPRAALVAPRLVGPDGRPRFVWAPDRGLLGEAVQRLRNPFEGRWWQHGLVDRLLRLVLGPGFYTGACLLLRRRAFDEVGGFDPAYFLYFEDADLSLRLRAAGWRLAYSPRARVVHVGGPGARDPAVELAYRQSQMYYYSRHRPQHEEQRVWDYLVEKYPDGEVASWLQTGGDPRPTEDELFGRLREFAAGRALPLVTRRRLARYFEELARAAARGNGDG